MDLDTTTIRSNFTSMMENIFEEAQEVMETLDLDWAAKLIKIKALFDIEKQAQLSWRLALVNFLLSAMIGFMSIWCGLHMVKIWVSYW